mmetsp:Transcript_36760/g.115118  ORF Transcript_36760/g.115118 Transcript_36760/m.115118 type:complete len:283 (-) Transcript_36760:2242-3090(-)
MAGGAFVSGAGSARGTFGSSEGGSATPGSASVRKSVGACAVAAGSLSSGLAVSGPLPPVSMRGGMYGSGENAGEYAAGRGTPPMPPCMLWKSCAACWSCRFREDAISPRICARRRSMAPKRRRVTLCRRHRADEGGDHDGCSVAKLMSDFSIFPSSAFRRTPSCRMDLRAVNAASPSSSLKPKSRASTLAKEEASLPPPIKLDVLKLFLALPGYVGVGADGRINGSCSEPSPAAARVCSGDFSSGSLPPSKSSLSINVGSPNWLTSKVEKQHTVPTPSTSTL